MNKVEKITALMKEVSDTLGIQTTQSNENTPYRVAKMLCNEVFEHLNNQGIEELDASMKTFPNDSNDFTPIVFKDLRFSSMCEHHWMPFMGTVTIEYIPCYELIGFSKPARVVRFFSKKPQLQERLTQEIGDYLYRLLKPVFLKVTITARHTCVSCRGAETECETTTLYQKGDVV